MLDTPESAFAIESVHEAAFLAREIQREMVGDALTKGDKSPVTVADFAVQAVMARRLAEHRPGETLIGEEQSDALRLEEGITTLEQVTRHVRKAVPDATPEEVCGLIDRGSGDAPATFWTLDPIDGTKGFLRREQYAVALAYIREGRVELGALGCPELDGGCILLAVHGRGVSRRSLDGGPWQTLQVSDRSDPTSARILRSVEKSHTNVDEIGQLAERLGTSAAPIGMDSQAKYAMLAAGEGDVLLRLLSPSRPDYREKIWDQAAGSIVVEEAGGRITDLDGKRLDFSQGRTLAGNRGIVATNGKLHDAVLDALRLLGA